MKIVINYQEYSNVNPEKKIIKDAFKNIQIVESHTRDPLEFAQEGHDADAALVQYVSIDRKVIDAMPKCRGYVRYGIACDTIDKEYSGQKGKIVANVPLYCIDEVSNHALAMILALNRKLLLSHRLFVENKYSLESLKPIIRLKDCTAGIVGMGTIGKTLAHKLKPLVKQILFFDPNLDSYDGCERTELCDVFKYSDYISLHLPLTVETKKIINRTLLKSMKSTACCKGPPTSGCIKSEN